MPSSRKYRDLRGRIRRLSITLSPKKFDPTGSYTEREIDRTSAFSVLAHAEIEWYLEEIVFETANKAYDSWRQHGLVTKPLLAVVAYAESHLGRVPQTIPTGTSSDLDDRIKKSLVWFNTYTKRSNHGIRVENILRLLLSVGISEFDIDQAWLATTNSFGQRRGEIAHTSQQVYRPPNPEDELNTVNQIVHGLKDIDGKLLNLRSQ